MLNIESNNKMKETTGAMEMVDMPIMVFCQMAVELHGPGL